MPAVRPFISLAIVFLLTGLIYLIRPFFPGFLPVGPASAPKPPLKPLPVERIVINHDQDRDGILDLDDIVEGARREVRAKTRYRSAYYQGGYPPEGEGVCTDVIWRALQNAGYDIKAMLDTDIKRNVWGYPRVNGRPEPNIDFRRVPNQLVFFKKHARSLTTEIKPGDPENLMQWQGGDIVVFGRPCEHIGIVSDRRRPDGVPLLIHNAGPHAAEEDRLLTWPSKITAHFRFPR